MNDLQRETPRTDAAWDDGDPLRRLSDKERREFAAQLERELDAAKGRADRLEAFVDLYNTSDRFIEGQPEAVAKFKAMTTELATLRAENEELRAKDLQWKEAHDLMQHKVITCGIIAEGNEHLNPIYQSGGKWDSQQAEQVRSLRAKLQTAQEALRFVQKEVGTIDEVENALAQLTEPKEQSET